jgi:hypothetical protein
MSPRRGSTPRLTDRLTVGRNATLTLHAIDKTILVNVNRNKYPVVRPTWALKPGLSDRLVVGRNVTLTLTLTSQPRGETKSWLMVGGASEAVTC